MVAYLPKLENALFLSWGGVSSDSEEEACDFFRLFVSSEMDTVASWKNHWIVLITHYCMDLYRIEEQFRTNRVIQYQ
jgi:hypothetical protein